ncbi:MAG: tRNA (guanosine(46)-N7)-methyltransferase TrmB [Planctomycetota bacterium]|nr:MAG: tRNA (guanosine(46)-N7)-methyltransferase TrmB [Planctomycetota bacterium]
MNDRTRDASGSNLPPSTTSHSAPRVQARDALRGGVEWRELVPDERPVELEIGSGKGLFLQTAATETPSHFFVGLELAAKFANRAAQRLHKHGISNAIVLRADAKRFLQESVPDAAVVGVHVYFPDPWWRNKHKKRRVLTEQTLEDIVRVLVPGGCFHFWTDVLDYYEHVCGMVMDHTRLEGPHYVPQRAAEHTMDYTTHFERRARLHDQPVYRALFVKPR